MKTRITLMLLALLLGFGTANATVPDSVATKKNPAKEIKSAIGYPEFALNQGIEGKVYLRLLVLEDGSMNILEAHCANNELLRYVVDHIDAMEFDPSTYQVGDPFNMVVSFSIY